MVVIAQRYKKIGHAGLVLSGILIGLSVLLFSLKGDLFLAITGLCCGILILLLSLYNVLSPTEAIVRDGDKLIFCFLFGVKEYSLSEFEYVSYHELGAWWQRKGNLFDYAVLKNDVRTLTVTVRRDGTLRYFRILGIEQASAVATSLNALKK